MLEVQNLHVAYGKIEALHGVNLKVPHGKIVSVIGRNGAGKTTLLNAISGLVRPRAGWVCLGGKPLPPAPHRTVAAGVVHVPEGRKVFPSLTVDENLTMGAFLVRASEIVKRRQEVYRLFPILQERSAQAAGTLSGGQQQMMAIGRGLMAGPRLMLLDEPSLGLAPLIVRQMFELIQEINRNRGLTIVLVEQNARKALSVADYAYVLENGAIVLEGPGAELARDPKVEAAYMGGRG